MIMTKEEVEREISATIRYHCDILNLTLSDMLSKAQKKGLKMSYNSLINKMNQNTSFTVSELYFIAKALNVDIETLIEETF